MIKLRNIVHLPRGRREQTTCQIFHKNVEILKFLDYIRNHLEKCNQISTNMPSIGLVNFECNEFGEGKTLFCMVKPNGYAVSAIKSSYTSARHQSHHCTEYRSTGSSSKSDLLSGMGFS